MMKIIKEKLPQGCIFVEKTDPEPTICPIDHDGLRMAIRFLEGSNGVKDESYVIVDKKILDKVFSTVLANLVNSFNDFKEDKLRFDDDLVSLKEDGKGKLIILNLNDDYSIIGEDVAGKLTNLSIPEIKTFSNFRSGIDPDQVLNVRQVGGSYKPTGDSSYFDALDRRNKDLREWNRRNKKELEAAGIEAAPEEKHGFLNAFKQAHSLTSSIAGAVGDVGSAIDAFEKLNNWWEKRKVNKAYEREEQISRMKTYERNRLSSMFLRSRLKKVEDDGFRSMEALTNIYNSGFSNILRAPHYFDPDYLKVLYEICTLCTANAIPPNKVINIRMNISQLSALRHKLESKYGKIV